MNDIDMELLQLKNNCHSPINVLTDEDNVINRLSKASRNKDGSWMSKSKCGSHHASHNDSEIKYHVENGNDNIPPKKGKRKNMWLIGHKVSCHESQDSQDIFEPPEKAIVFDAIDQYNKLQAVEIKNASKNNIKLDEAKTNLANVDYHTESDSNLRLKHTITDNAKSRTSYNKFGVNELVFVSALFKSLS